MSPTSELYSQFGFVTQQAVVLVQQTGSLFSAKSFNKCVWKTGHFHKSLGETSVLRWGNSRRNTIKHGHIFSEGEGSPGMASQCQDRLQWRGPVHQWWGFRYWSVKVSNCLSNSVALCLKPMEKKLLHTDHTYWYNIVVEPIITEVKTSTVNECHSKVTTLTFNPQCNQWWRNYIRGKTLIHHGHQKC